MELSVFSTVPSKEGTFRYLARRFFTVELESHNLSARRTR